MLALNFDCLHSFLSSDFETSKKEGHFWTVSQLLQFILLRPKQASFEREFLDVKSKIGWESIERPLLSIHVRHGDSVRLH